MKKGIFSAVFFAFLFLPVSLSCTVQAGESYAGGNNYAVIKPTPPLNNRPTPPNNHRPNYTHSSKYPHANYSPSFHNNHRYPTVYVVNYVKYVKCDCFTQKKYYADCNCENSNHRNDKNCVYYNI